MSLSESLTNLASQYRNGMQFSYKLALHDMVYLATVNGLTPVPGVNALQNTDPDINDISNAGGASGIQDSTKWALTSGGNGQLKTIDLDSSFKAKHGFEIYNNNGGNRDITQRPLLLSKNKYTLSFYAKSQSPQLLQVRVFDLTDLTNDHFEQHFNLSAEKWQKFQCTIDYANLNNLNSIDIQIGGVGFTGAIDFAEPMLEVGDTAHDWSPSPIDGLN